MSKKISKRDRLSLYKKALKVIYLNHKAEREPLIFDFGLCYAITYARCIETETVNGSRIKYINTQSKKSLYTKNQEVYNHMDYFPEIQRHEPIDRRNCNYWFPMNEEGTQARIRILQEAISELEQPKKTS